MAVSNQQDALRNREATERASITFTRPVPNTSCRVAAVSWENFASARRCQVAPTVPLRWSLSMTRWKISWFS